MASITLSTTKARRSRTCSRLNPSGPWSTMTRSPCSTSGHFPNLEVRSVVGRRAEHRRRWGAEVAGPHHVADLVVVDELLDVRLAGQHAQRGLGLGGVVIRLVVVPDVDGIRTVRRNVKPDPGHAQDAARRLRTEPRQALGLGLADLVLRRR